MKDEIRQDHLMEQQLEHLEQCHADWNSTSNRLAPRNGNNPEVCASRHDSNPQEGPSGSAPVDIKPFTLTSNENTYSLGLMLVDSLVFNRKGNLNA